MLENTEQLLKWAGDEGWNPGLDDATAFHASDPAGFILERNGTEPAAGISVVNHTADFAFLGLYIAAPDFRGHGLGWRAWQAGIAHAGARTIGLDGVPEQQENYRKSGFVNAGATWRWQGQISGGGTGLRQALPGDLTALKKLDTQATGVARQRFQTAWFSGSDQRKTVLLGDGDQITGYATVRLCLHGVKIGPLSAQNSGDAEQLLRAAAGVFDNDSNAVMIDVPASNKALSNLLRDYGLEPGFSTARMYRGPQPKADPPRFYGVATLELG